MKIHEYNEMMSYLTRPAMNTGGTIGGGIIQGQNIGYRTGFAGPELVTKGENKNSYFVKSTVTDPISKKRKSIRTYFKVDGINHKNLDEAKKAAEEFYQGRMKLTGELRGAGRLNAVEAHTKAVNSWVDNWINTNIDNYGLRNVDDFLKNMVDDLKKSEGKFSKTKALFRTGFPNIGDRKSNFPFKAFDLPELNFASKNKSVSENFFRRLFFANKINKDPILKKAIGEYMEYITLNKQGLRAKQLGDLKNYYSNAFNNLDDVMYVLSKDIGLESSSAKALFETLYPDSYTKYRDKMNASSKIYLNNVKKIEDKLGPKRLKQILGGKTSIIQFMVDEGKELSKIFDVSQLPKGADLGYSVEHNLGISEISRMDDIDEMEQALKSLRGMTMKRNKELGFNTYSIRRKKLRKDISKGINVTDNLDDLNKLTETVYPEIKGKKAYELVDGVAKPTKDFIYLTDVDTRFSQYFEELATDPKGKTELIKQTEVGPNPFKLKQLLAEQLGVTIQEVENAVREAGIKATDNKNVIYNKVKNAPIPNRFKAPALALIAGAAAITGADLMTSKLQAAEPGQMPQGSPGQLSEDEEGLSLQDKAAIGTVAVAGAKPAFQAAKAVGKGALKTIGAPAVGLGFAGTTIAGNLAEGKNIADAVVDPMVGVDLLLPEIVKQLGTNITPKNVLSKILSLQILDKVPYAAKVGLASKIVRGMTPVGAGLTTAGLLKDRAINMAEQAETISALEPNEEQQRLIDEYAAADYKGFYNQGGRVGFDEGSKPKNPSRRAFIKGVTALAALPLVGRFFKLTDVAKQASTYMGPTIEKIKGMPEWFPSLVKKLWNEGDDVTKQVAYGERQVVKRGTLEGGDDVDMIYSMDTGDVSINVTPKKGAHETTSGAYNKEYSLDYQKGQADEMTKGKKPPDDFTVSELEPRQMSPEDIELDGTMTTVDDALTDLTELEAFAKSKSTKQIHKKKGTKKKEVFPDYDPY